MHVHVPLYVAERFMKSSKNGRYGAAVECIDWSVGVLLDELKQLGLDENTLVVFTSDNGSNIWAGGCNDPRRGKKGQTWEGGMRVPCLMRWPDTIPAGTECSEIATAMDFLPTFTKLADGDIPADRIIDGKDIAPLMTGDQDAKSPHETFFYYRKDSLCAVRNDQWKLHVKTIDLLDKDATPRVWGPVDILELYNLKEDVGETTNLAEEHPEVVAELQAKLQACREDIGDEAEGVAGANVRPIGRVENPKPLTEYDESHPYIIAMYDLPDRG